MLSVLALLPPPSARALSFPQRSLALSCTIFDLRSVATTSSGSGAQSVRQSRSDSVTAKASCSQIDLLRGRPWTGRCTRPFHPSTS
jgi:hypothetical protein